jgi:hypothetical protein
LDRVKRLDFRHFTRFLACFAIRFIRLHQIAENSGKNAFLLKTLGSTLSSRKIVWGHPPAVVPTGRGLARMRHANAAQSAARDTSAETRQG